MSYKFGKEVQQNYSMYFYEVQIGRLIVQLGITISVASIGANIYMLKYKGIIMKKIYIVFNFYFLYTPVFSRY